MPIRDDVDLWNDGLFVSKFDHVAARQFLTAASFRFAVDENFARLNTDLGFATGSHHSLVFEKLIEAEWFCGHGRFVKMQKGDLGFSKCPKARERGFRLAFRLFVGFAGFQLLLWANAG